MRLMYKLNSSGYYIPGEDFYAESVGENCTDIPPLDGDGRGMYKPRFVDGEWVEEGRAPEIEPSPPTIEEKISKLEEENEQLKNSVAFMEDMIVILTMP